MDEGDVVAGVRLSARIGRGATGEVWAGTDLADGARVAVKLVHDGSADVEAMLLHGLRHPHVLGVRRVRHDPPAVVTDLAGGGSLSAQVGARGRLEPGEVVTVVSPLADALAWLHGRGVVHGDVSGPNVLFVERGRPVLADLGAARLAGDGRAVATPGFAAPEVLAGASAGPPADVHGLGAVAWLALTGSVPPSFEDRLPLRLLVPECPDALVDAVNAAVDPDPSKRPSPSELAAQVRSACRAEAVRLVPSAAVGVRADEAVTYRVREAAAREGEGRRARRRRLRGFALPSRCSHAPSASLPSFAPTSTWRTRTVRLTPVGILSVLLVAVAAAVALTVGLLPHQERGAGASAARVDQTGGAAGTAGDARGDTIQDTVVRTGAGASGGEVAVPSPTADVGSGSGDVALGPAVAALVRAREDALRAGDVDALARVHHPDGTTLGPDRALLAGGPVDVRYQVLSVRPIDDHAAAVDVVTRGAAAPPVQESVVVELGRLGGRWLVVSVSDRPATGD